jgi:hypothetical protein
MRVTIDHRKHVATAVIAAAIALSLVLLMLVVVGGTATSGRAGEASTAAHSAAEDAGPVNPWAAGDAAAQQELADLGREHLDACP